MIPVTRKKRRRDTEIAVTNLVDVIFVLLIFFVLTATFTKETGVDITKPRAAKSTQLAKDHFRIGVTREGGIFVNDRQIDLSMLSALLRREVSRDPEMQVVISSDRSTDMGIVVDILDECNIVGTKKVSVNTDPE